MGTSRRQRSDGHASGAGVTGRDDFAEVRGRRRFVPVLILMVFAPVSAEYLIGYDTIAGDPAALVFGLIIFAPLYGAPALLIREIVCRTNRGWPSILLLGAAFGLIQAGLIDQGLVNPAYRDIPYWTTLREPTFIAPLGTSAFMLFHFTALHAFGSVYAPVTVAEALSGGRRARPWLRTPGVFVTAAVWLVAALYIAVDTIEFEGWQASVSQVVGVLVAACGLTWFGLRTRRPSFANGRVPAPPAAVVAVISLVLLAVRPLLAALSPAGRAWNSWGPTLLAMVAVALWWCLMSRWTRAPGWNGVHELAAAAGYLLAVGLTAFAVSPLGRIGVVAKYASNVVLLGLVMALVAVAWTVQHRQQGLPTRD